MKDYVVLAHLGTEAIFLEAESAVEALRMANEAIAESYGDYLANSESVRYEIQV